MKPRTQMLVATAVVVPVLLVGAAVLAAGANAWSALFAAGAAACLAGLQALTLIHVRRSRQPVVVAPRRPDREQQRTAAAAGASAEVVWQSGVPIPPNSLRFMGEDDAKFVETARELARLLSHAGMSDTAAVLDVGSGYGRLAAGLLGRDDFRGTYVGFDILPKHVGWCTKVITAHDPRFRFVHLDVVNERYNPTGTVPADEIRFPVADASADVCSLFSVFTHMYRPAIQHYLEEISRTLRPGGIAVTTWFLFDEARLPAVTAETSKYQLTHVLDDGARYMSTEDPLHVIAYPQADLAPMVEAAGLVLDRVQRGRWAADEPDSPDATFQDLVVLRKP